MDNLLEIIVDIRNRIYENKITRAAFVDVSSAYDNVQRNILIKQLYKIKCPKKIMSYINQWMGGRQIKFLNVDENTEQRKVWVGLPQ